MMPPTLMSTWLKPSTFCGSDGGDWGTVVGMATPSAMIEAVLMAGFEEVVVEVVVVAAFLDVVVDVVDVVVAFVVGGGGW
jgi:hypothetical protein